MTLAEFWQLLKDALPIITVIGGTLYTWVLWSLHKNFVSNVQCEQRRDALGADIGEVPSAEALQQMLDNLPTAKEVSDLSAEIKVLKTALDGTRDLQRRIERQVDMMDTFLRSLRA